MDIQKVVHHTGVALRSISTSHVTGHTSQTWIGWTADRIRPGSQLSAVAYPPNSGLLAAHQNHVPPVRQTVLPPVYPGHDSARPPSATLV